MIPFVTYGKGATELADPNNRIAEDELFEEEELYISVSELENGRPDPERYGIFSFLADQPIFGVEPVKKARPERSRSAEAAGKTAQRPAPQRPERVKNPLYDWIYLFGLGVIRAVKHLWRQFSGALRKPFHALAVFAGLIYILIDKIALRSLHNTAGDMKKLRADAKGAMRHLRRSFSGQPKEVVKRFLGYPKRALQLYPGFFRTAFNVLLPAAAFAVLVVTVVSYTSATYALEVVMTNNGEETTLGYISNESVFIDAKNIVKQRIDSGVSDQALIATPTYRIKRVSIDQLNDANTISDKLIEESDAGLTSACGVYIDGDFVCSVKNETDARSVFDNMLDEAEKEYKISESDENSFADFIEDIEFVQGLYPDNSDKMWEASRLADTLKNDTKSAAVYYTVQDGDTPSGVAAKFDISTSALQANNPGVDFNTFKSGTKLTVSQEVHYVRIQIKKIEERNVETPFSVETEKTNKLYSGTKRVVRKGVKGVDKVTYMVTYIDGTKISSKEISRVTLVEPINQKEQIGTKSASGYSSYGSRKSTTKYSKNYGVYASSSKGRFTWPVPGVTTISSPYGRRRSGFHTGIDISNGRTNGKVVVAADSGVVESVKFSHKSYGNQIVINHGNGYKTRYAHLLDNSIGVSVGQRVARGQGIARVGSTGNSTGPHLHFEVIVNGNTVNPMNYL